MTEEHRRLRSQLTRMGIIITAFKPFDIDASVGMHAYRDSAG